MGISQLARSGHTASSPIPVWRYGRGLLVHHGPARAIGIDELLATAGQSGYDSPSYVLVDGGGTVVDTFSVSAWSLPGERGASFHIVDSGCLLKVTVRELAGGAPVVSTTPVLAGLDAVPPGDASAQARAAAILRSDVDATALRLGK